VTAPSGEGMPETDAALPLEQTRPPIAFSGIVYGECVYWVTILGSIIAIVGATIAMLGVKNYLDPSYVFSSIWEGKSTTDIWEGAVGQIPRGHWYLPRLGTGDGLAMFGLALGVFSVIPGMIAAAVVMLKKKDTMFGVLALVASILCITACIGLIQVPE
jgi:hypothetical protein